MIMETQIKHNEKLKDVVYSTDAVHRYMEVMRDLEEVVCKGPMNSPLLEASLMAHAEMVRERVNYLVVCKPKLLTLGYCLEWEGYTSRLYEEIYTLLNNVGLWVRGVVRDKECGYEVRSGFPTMMESCYDGNEETKRLYEQMQRCSLALGEMYMKELKFGLHQILKSGEIIYSGVEWNGMINDQYEYFWNRVWREESRSLCIDLETSEENKMDRLRGMRRELYERLKGNVLYRVHINCCDKEGRHCDHLRFANELRHSMFYRRWTLGDLNDYFDIVVREDFVERMLAGEGAPEYKPYVEDVEAMVDDRSEEEKVCDEKESVLNDFGALVKSLRWIFKKPYNVDRFVEAVKGYVREGEVRYEEFVSLFSGKMSDRKFGGVSLSVFFAFTKLLMDEGIVEQESPTKVVNGVKNYFRLPKDWDFCSVFSKSWDGAKVRRDSGIKAMVAEIKREGWCVKRENG